MKVRQARISDAELIFRWASEPSTRANSYNATPIDFQDHLVWYRTKLNSDQSFIFIFEVDGQPIGQIRFEFISPKSAIVSISIDSTKRGQGLAPKMLDQAQKQLKRLKGECTIIANVFKSNIPSFKSFIKAGFRIADEKKINDIPSWVLIK